MPTCAIIKTNRMNDPGNGEIMERIGKISETDRSFDVEFWQRQGPNAIFAAAWEMVEEAYRWKGGSESERAFQRTVERLKPLRG